MQIERISPEMALPKLAPVANAAQAATPVRFQDLLLEGVERINQMQTEAGDQVRSFVEGHGPAVHTVMLNLERAQLTLELAVQVRNKMLDAYNEIMRMQM